MSLRRQAEARGPIFTGAGYRPAWIPTYQVALETGMIASTSRMRKKILLYALLTSFPKCEAERFSSIPLCIPLPNDRGASLGPVASSDVRLSIGRQG